MAPAVPFSPHQQSQHCPDIHYENTKLRSSIVKIFIKMTIPGQVLCWYLWKYQAQVKNCQDIYGNTKPRSSIVQLFMKTPDTQLLLRASIVQIFMEMPDTLLWSPNPVWDELNVKITTIDQKSFRTHFNQNINAVKMTLLGSWSSLRIRFRSPIHFAVVLKGEPSLLGRYPIAKPTNPIRLPSSKMSHF